MGELVAALRANDSDAFRGLLSEGIQELGATEVEDLLLDWLYSFLTTEEQVKLMGWHTQSGRHWWVLATSFCQ